MSNNFRKKFKVRPSRSTEEDRIKRRAITFGLLTIVLLVGIAFWGIPLFIRLVNLLGDVKTEREDLTRQEDTIPPITPRLASIPEATNSASLDIEGFAEPKSEVKIEFNEEIIDVQVDEEGSFKISKLFLEEGINSLSAWSKDESGNTSEETDVFNIIYDKVSPELEILSPENNSKTEEQSLEVKGKTESDARVTVNEHVVIVGKEGEFSTEIVLQEGGNEIVVVSEDKAGNTTERKLNVTYAP